MFLKMTIYGLYGVIIYGALNKSVILIVSDRFFYKFPMMLADVLLPGNFFIREIRSFQHCTCILYNAIPQETLVLINRRLLLKNK